MDATSKRSIQVSEIRDRISVRKLLLIAGVAVLLPIAACNKKSAPAEAAAPGAATTFSSPEAAGKALADAAGLQNHNAIVAIFGPGSEGLVSTGVATEDTAAMASFVQAYKVMNRWRKLPDGSELLIVGADNQVFPLPLVKNASGQWHFDAAAGKQEILTRNIGRNELSAIDVASALANAQEEYFAQKHGGVQQYAQKFVSTPGQQNGLYWEASQDSARSPLGPLVAYASEEGLAANPSIAQPFYGYYFRELQSQGSAAQGGAKTYVVNGKMTNGFAYVAYPAEYYKTGIKTFIINQRAVIFQKDLGKDTTATAKSMTEFNPDSSWAMLQ